MTSGYATVTYKMKLTCKRLDWLRETKVRYNRVRTFYHALLQNHEELHGLGSQAMLRELEKLSIADRSGKQPVSPLPCEGVPAYFRRSAANGAIGAFQTYLKNHRQWKKDHTFQIREPKPAGEFHSSPVFYKGMYKDFTQNSITLKLWTGSSWAWVRCKYRGRSIPAEAEFMSPTVVIGKKNMALHIPVKLPVNDTRPVKERLVQGDPICSVAFTNTDVFAVCSIHQVDGRAAASRFIRGGAEYAHHSKRLLERIKSNRAVMGKRFDWTGCNKRYWKRLYDLSDYWAHKVSREIVDFCLQSGVTTIVLLESDYEKMRFIAKRAGKYSPIYLSLRIRRYLTYKAWQAGIAITMVRAGVLTKTCSNCGCEIKNKGIEAAAGVYCSNGHQLNRDLNTARNVGRACLTKLGMRPA